MVSHEFWRDSVTGQVWAVRLTDGDVTAAYGPLASGQVDASWLATYPFDDNAWIQSKRERFRLISEQELLMLSAETD